MKIEFIKNAGVYIEGDIVEMERRRADQYIRGGHAKVYVAPKPIIEEKPAPKPKAKPKAKPKKKADAE